MAINISLLFVPWPIFLGALILVVSAIIVLTIVERRLHRRVILKKEYEDTYYHRKLEEVRALENEPDKYVNAIDLVAREFFEEEFKVTGVRYSDLIENLRREGKEDAVTFCEVMQEVLYSGQKITPRHMTLLFEKMMILIREKERQETSKMRALEKVAAQQSTQPRASPQAAKPQSETPVLTPSVNMNLVKYLTEGRTRGFSFESLKKKLLEAGFKEDDIMMAREYVLKEDAKKKPAQKIPVQSYAPALTKFLHPNGKEIDTIKREVVDDKMPEEIIEVVPYKREHISIPKKKPYPQEEPESYKYIANMDDLKRVEKKLKNRGPF